MKRILQTLLLALLVIFALDGVAATKPNAETKRSKTMVKEKPTPSREVEEAARAEKEKEAQKTATANSAGSATLPNLLTDARFQDVEDSDPDIPQRFRGRIDKAEYIRLRDEYIGMLRGVDSDALFDVSKRVEAVRNMERAIERRPEALGDPAWLSVGPSPVPNGQTQQFPAVAPVSGRATCVVVDPTNSSKVYLGTAQGGVWRSTDGGATWKPIFDAAQSLAIGALALAPSNPTILYVGTGEPNNSADSYFGVGVYRIDNADTTADLVGPINPQITTGTTTALTYNCFNGRAISKILVNPIDPANIFVSTAAAVASAAGNALSNTIPPLALRGVFRSTNATAAAGTVTFQKIVVNTDGSLDNPGTGNTSIFDMVFEPGNANNLLVSTSGTATGGVIMRSTNALAATPTFTQVLFPGFNGLVMHLAINKVGAVVTAYVASNEPSGVAACSGSGQAGRVRKSVDGGVTWSAPLVAAEGYCGGQCSYDNPIGVDPNDANIVYIGGNARGSCSDVLKRSADGGTTFLRDDTGLHADSHGITIDGFTVPSTVWFVNDGGVWKRPDAVAGTPWLNQNTNRLSTLQFVSLAVHPTDPFLTLGGTQDNGTEAMAGAIGNWVSAESGDGGFALIDQSSTDATNVTMYHTFFNGTNNFIGFDRTNLGTCLPPPDTDKDSWEFRGAGFANDPTLSCDGTAFTIQNGINVADTVLFYAPMALGPGTPNTIYFGTNKLYRSTDRGDTMTAVSQTLVAGVAVSAIGIAPANDNVRIVGLRNGKVFATTTGANPLVDTTFVPPTNATASATNKHIGRAVIDPLNSNTAYVTLSYYTNPATAGQIWRTTNLNGAPPTWTSIGNTATGLPNVPVNAFAVDGSDSNFPGVSVLYAGTDIGVYRSTDSGATWVPFGNPVLPRVAIFDMAIQPSHRILRVATHGRGVWQINLPTAAACVPPPTPSVTPAGTVASCGAPSVTLTSSSATGNQWYAGTELMPGETNQTYVATMSGNYSVVTTSAGGCTSVRSAATTVNFVPAATQPTITPGGPTTFCAGGSVTLTSSSATGNQWNLNGNPIGGATNQAYIASLAGDYTVTATNVNTCSATSAVTTVTVNALPETPTISGTNTFCTGGNTTLTSSSATGNQWNRNGNPIGGETNQQLVVSTAGDYTVTVTDGNTCSSTSAITTVTETTIPPTPTIAGTTNGTGTQDQACPEQPLTLTATSAGATSFQWYSDNAPLGGETASTYIATGVGNFHVVAFNGTCASPDSATYVVQNPTPHSAFLDAAGPTTFCAGGSVTLQSNSATGIQWYRDTGSGPVAIAGAGSQNYVATVAGTYTVILNALGCHSQISNSIVVTVNPIPATPTATPGGPTTFCAGGTVTLTSSSASGNQWLLNGNPIAGETAQQYIASATGNYTVTVTTTGCTSAPSSAVSVTVNPIPATPTITPSGPTTFCTGGSVTLTSSSASGNQWYVGGNPIGGATAQQYVATASGSYTVVVTSSGCSSAPSTATVVTVNPIPATPTITPSGPTTFCAGGSVTLTSSSASGNQWYVGGNPIGGATAQQYVATATGSYTVVVTSTGCSSPASAATNVTVNPVPATPTITPSGPTTFCTGGSVTLTSSSASGNQWSLNGNPIGGATAQQYVANVAGDYTVTVTATGCSSAASAVTTVTINATPNATITAPGSVVSGSTGNIASVANAGAGASYAWTVGNGTLTGGNNTPSITFTAGAAGTLTLNVTVTTGAGCSDAKSANVTVTAAPPTVFVTSVNPNHGSTLGGRVVTIQGSGFNAGATVTFGGSAATNVVVTNSTHINAKTPAHAVGAVNVTVTNTNASTGTLTNGYTYVVQGFDPNNDGTIDPSDIFYLVAYLFTGGPAPEGPAGMPSGDANGDVVVDPADIFYAVNYLFGGGPEPHLTAPGSAVTTSVAAPFSGAVTLGPAVRRDGHSFVPVIVTMDPNSSTPAALSLRVRFSDPTAEAAMRRGAGLEPIFEISRRNDDALSYLVAFNDRAPFVLGASRSAVIAEIEVSSNGANRLEIDPALTMLVSANGTNKATVANHALRVSGTSIGGIDPTPRPRSQNDN